MITLLTGENSFEIRRSLDKIISDFMGQPEMIDGADLQTAQLFDALMSVSLFADRRLVIINNPSSVKSIWSSLGEWLPKVSEDIHVVLVEAKPDKRTSTYKMLQDYAVTKEFQPWTDRDMLQIESWVINEAKSQNVVLDKKLARLLIHRAGIDQWQLFHAVEKLALVDDVSVETINEVIDASPAENVFNLFETAVCGSMNNLRTTFNNIKQTEDVYRLFALLSTQAFQLAVVANASKADNVAKDFGIHPYVVSKVRALANDLGKDRIAKIISIFAQSDSDMKHSKTDPWAIVEQTLIKIGNAYSTF
ncbi:MAG: DNA polymerase III subunit delta [Candidatus Saccharimonadales bacterium]